MIVYPAIDIYEGRAVRMTRGDFATVEEVAPSPLEAARKLVADGAEWLHIIDLDGSRTGKPGNLDHLRAIANRFTVKIQAGGGLSVNGWRRLPTACRPGKHCCTIISMNALHWPWRWRLSPCLRGVPGQRGKHSAACKRKRISSP